MDIGLQTAACLPSHISMPGSFTASIMLLLKQYFVHLAHRLQRSFMHLLHFLRFGAQCNVAPRNRFNKKPFYFTYTIALSTVEGSCTPTYLFILDKMPSSSLQAPESQFLRFCQLEELSSWLSAWCLPPNASITIRGPFGIKTAGLPARSGQWHPFAQYSAFVSLSV